MINEIARLRSEFINFSGDYPDTMTCWTDTIKKLLVELDAPHDVALTYFMGMMIVVDPTVPPGTVYLQKRGRIQ